MHRFATRGMLVCALSALTWGCNENTLGTGSDGTAPTVAILMPDTVVDVSQGLQFTVNASDNISLLTVGWSVTGPIIVDSTTTFSTTTPAFSEAVTIPITANSGTFVIIARATDGGGLVAAEDTVIATIDTTLLPTAVFLQPNPTGPLLAVRVGDSTRVRVHVQDTRGLAKVTVDGVALRGSATLGTLTAVQRFTPKVVDDLVGVTDTIIVRDLLPTGDQTAEFALLRAIVEDAQGHVDTATVQIDISAGPVFQVVAPVDSSQVTAGFVVDVDIAGQGSAISYVGYITSGILPGVSDTVFYTVGSQPDSVLETFPLTVPGGTPPGFFDVTPLGQDSAGNLGSGQPLTLEIVAVGGAGDTQPPLITDSLESRVEVDDGVLVRGSDLSGIDRLGYIVENLAGTVVSGDSVIFAGNRTNEENLFSMRLDTVVATFPAQLVIKTFGVDVPGNRGESSPDGTTPTPPPGRADTITVVAGITVPLPLGGQVADAIYNGNLPVAGSGELYLTNTELDRLEVFDIATRTFVAAIPIGSRPWGIALWPQNTITGANADTVVVANSGGTNLSIVDVAARIEARRHALPNFIIQTVDTKENETGFIEFNIEEHDFSDRPQFLGMVCRPAGGGACQPDSLLAVYSTTPTIDQGIFTKRGTVRWENLTACDPVPPHVQDCVTPATDSLESHFFWEHATSVANEATDTLQILVDRGGTDRDTILWAGRGVMVNELDIAFQDTTFVRNSGDFTHALIGEGGEVGFARAIGYDATAGVTNIADAFDLDPNGVLGGLVITATTVTDLGISPGIRIRDFIANTATPIKSIAINFNGLTNLVRTDSVYVLNEILRLTGLVGVPGSNYGMDLNFDHVFDADLRGTAVPGDSDARLVFTAMDTPEVVAWDTWNFGEVARVPIRDPIIGPLRVAKLPSGEQLLVGVTQAGVVTVTLPSISNPFLTPPGGGGRDR